MIMLKFKSFILTGVALIGLIFTNTQVNSTTNGFYLRNFINRTVLREGYEIDVASKKDVVFIKKVDDSYYKVMSKKSFNEGLADEIINAEKEK